MDLLIKKNTENLDICETNQTNLRQADEIHVAVFSTVSGLLGVHCNCTCCIWSLQFIWLDTSHDCNGCIRKGGLGLCQWYYVTDLENRKRYNNLSLKFLLSSVPQLFAALLLLYYACTFSRASSTFIHRMVVNSCLHQGVTSLLLASFVFSAFQVSLSVCCSFPAFCPVDPTACKLHRIVACPKSVAHLTNYNLSPRLIHCCATFTMLFAMSSIEAVHVIKDLNSRVHHARFITFSRHEPIHEASAAVVF